MANTRAKRPRPVPVNPGTKKTAQLLMWILLALAFGTCQNDPVDPVASVTPADGHPASLSARPDSSKFVPAPSAKVPNSYILKTHTEKDARAVAERIATEYKGIIKFVYPSLPGLAITLRNPDSTPDPPDLSKLLEDGMIVRVSEERILEMTGARPPRGATLGHTDRRFMEPRQDRFSYIHCRRHVSLRRDCVVGTRLRNRQRSSAARRVRRSSPKRRGLRRIGRNWPGRRIWPRHGSREHHRRHQHGRRKNGAADPR